MTIDVKSAAVQRPVTVSVTRDELEDCGSSWTVELMVLDRLRRAGAPVEGLISPKLRTGVVDRHLDIVSGNWTLIWRPAKGEFRGLAGWIMSDRMAADTFSLRKPL